MNEQETKIASYIERAKEAQETRRSAPSEVVGGKSIIPQKKIIERLAAATGGQDNPDGFHYWFGDRDLLDEYFDKGNEPALTREKKWEHYQGDPCLRIPTDIYMRELERLAATSRRMIKDGPIMEAAEMQAAKDLGVNPESISEQTEIIDEAP